MHVALPDGFGINDLLFPFMVEKILARRTQVVYACSGPSMKGIRAERSTFALAQCGPSVTSRRGGMPPDASVWLSCISAAATRQSRRR
jgi:hypothetical protein